MILRELRVFVGHPDNGQLIISGKDVESVEEAERGAMGAHHAIPLEQLIRLFLLFDMSDRYG